MFRQVYKVWINFQEYKPLGFSPHIFIIIALSNVNCIILILVLINGEFKCHFSISHICICVSLQILPYVQVWACIDLSDLKNVNSNIWHTFYVCGLFGSGSVQNLLGWLKIQRLKTFPFTCWKVFFCWLF